MKRLASALLVLATLVLLFLSLLGSLGQFHWFFDLFSHFRWQWLIAALALTAVYFIPAMRQKSYQRIFLLLNIALALWHGIGIATTGNITPPTTRQPALKIVCFNVLVTNTRYAETLQWLQQQDADVIFLSEVNRQWATAMSPLLLTHPHYLIPTKENGFGMALYSRVPLSKKEVIYPTGSETPLIHFVIESSGLACYAIHPPPPRDKRWASSRNATFDWIKGHGPTRNFWIMGDANASPWSYNLKSLRDAKGLDFRAVTRPIWPTWQRNSRLNCLAIPIDHALCTPDLTFSQYRIGPNLGSDHRPLLLELSRL